MADFDKQVTGRCYSDFAGGARTPQASGAVAIGCCPRTGLKPFCEKQLPSILERWARLLGDKHYLTGLAGPSSDVLTVADLKFYETLRKLRIIEAEPAVGTSTLAAFPKLLAFLDRVETTPALKAYTASDAFLGRPLNNAHAQYK